MPDVTRQTRVLHNGQHEPGPQEAQQANDEYPRKEQAQNPDLGPIYRLKTLIKQTTSRKLAEFPDWDNGLAGTTF